MSETREEAAEAAIDRKEEAAEATVGLDHPSRSGSTGADVGSGRAPDELSQQSVEEAARENAEPLNEVTGVDDVRDPSHAGGVGGNDDEE